MADVTPQQLPAPDALAQYRSLLDQRIDGHSQLVPLDVLPALEREIEATLQPAHSREGRPLSRRAEGSGLPT